MKHVSDFFYQNQQNVHIAILLYLQEIYTDKKIPVVDGTVRV